MRPIGTVLIVVVTVFVGGALIAPWLYWSAQMSADLSPWFAELARQPFHRYVHRSLLGLAIPGLWFIAWQNGLTSWRDLGMRRSPLAGRQFISGALLGLLSLAAVGLLALVFDARRWNSNLSPALLGGSIISALAAALVVSPLEELLFRGALFGGLRRGSQWATALLGSSTVYALVHFFRAVEWTKPIKWDSGLLVLGQMLEGLIDPHALAPGFFVLLLAGLILGLAYQKTNALWFSIGAHAGWIFWLKIYGVLTVEHSAGLPALWGSSKLIDGWIAAVVLLIPAVLLWDSNRLRNSDVRVA